MSQGKPVKQEMKINEVPIRLGDRARDQISGFEGIAVARTEWLNGCVRITLQPMGLHEGRPLGNETFDQEQLELLDTCAFGTAERRKAGGDRPGPTRAADPR